MLLVLTLSMLDKFNQIAFCNIFLIFREKRVRHFILERICMTCQTLIPGKNKRNVTIFSSANLAKREC